MKTSEKTAAPTMSIVPVRKARCTRRASGAAGSTRAFRRVIGPCRTSRRAGDPWSLGFGHCLATGHWPFIGHWALGHSLVIGPPTLNCFAIPGHPTQRNLNDQRNGQGPLDNVAKRVEIQVVIRRSTLGAGVAVRRRRNAAGSGSGLVDHPAGGDGHGRPITPDGPGPAHQPSSGDQPSIEAHVAVRISTRGSDPTSSPFPIQVPS